MRNHLSENILIAFFVILSVLCCNAKDSTKPTSHKAISQSKSPIFTIDPFKVDGMTIISPMKNGELAAYASDFVATVRFKTPNSKTISFKAIDLYNTALSVSVNGRKAWQPDISGFKDFKKSPSIPILPDSTQSDSVTVKVIVDGLHGGLKLFEIYSE